MSGRKQELPEATQTAAAAWVVRLQAPAAGEAEWLAFEVWLRGTPGGEAAYDAAMSIWLLADAYDGDSAGANDDRDVGRRAWGGVLGKPPGLRMAVLGLGGLGAVTTAWVMAVHEPARLTAPRLAPAAQVYATARGERRAVTLADGTRLDLSGGSRVTVRLAPGARRISMDEGEVAFDVTHDPSRPFEVSVGDRQVRDVGTEFDIRRAGSQIRIAVRRGMVEVAANNGSKDAPIDLGPGRQLTHDQTSDVTTVRTASADDAFAWKQGRLIYRDQPLQVVVDDLNRSFPHGVRIEGARAAEMHFTGVLNVDAEDATIRRLTALLPISASRVGGATVLKARDQDR
jgi:transmembrane sensor